MKAKTAFTDMNLTETVSAVPSPQEQLLEQPALQKVEQICQDPPFIPNLIDLFGRDTAALLARIDEELSKDWREVPLLRRH